MKQSLATVVAIGVLAYVLGDVLHEGVGHGGACLAGGDHAVVMSSVHFECTRDSRLLSAGGTLVNLIAGGLLWLALRAARGTGLHLRYFLWIAMTVNLLDGTGYFLYSGFAGIGDWQNFIAGLAPQWAWRVGLIALGGVGYWLTVWLALSEARWIAASRAQLRALTLWPYLAGGILSCVSGAFNPVGMWLVAISAAAASFGGTSALAWMSRVYDGGVEPDRAVSLSWGWIVAAVIASIVFVAVLGPGIRFRAAS